MIVELLERILICKGFRTIDSRKSSDDLTATNQEVRSRLPKRPSLEHLSFEEITQRLGDVAEDVVGQSDQCGSSVGNRRSARASHFLSVDRDSEGDST